MTAMQPVHIVGVDPGLVHTGVVSLVFDPEHEVVRVDHTVAFGPDVSTVTRWVRRVSLPVPSIFIEAYTPRSHFAADQRMVETVARLQRMLKGSVLRNTGITQVVRKPLMELLGVWKFATPTHHQDLRSAARIALLGMLKQEDLNLLLTAVVTAHLQGRDWSVQIAPAGTSTKGKEA